MTYEPIRIDDLARIDVRRVIGAGNDLYALTGGGTVWVHMDSWWQLLPLPGAMSRPMAPDRRAVDFYMHASRYDGHGSDIHEHHKFTLRVLDHSGTLWELRFCAGEWLWDKVTP